MSRDRYWSARAVSDLTGKRFGTLTVLGMIRQRYARARCNVRCSCGKTLQVTASDLLSNNTRSCGCRRYQSIAEANRNRKSHGATNTRVFVVWTSMHRRCYDISHKSFPYYGGREDRPIQIDWVWHRDNPKGFSNFARFYEKNYKPGLTIDRENNDRNYGPRNCRFATAKQQANNRRKRTTT